MSGSGTILGTLVQYDIPSWEPLYGLVGVDLADWFMWMCEIELADRSRVHAYKHIATRCSFHIAEDGRVFAYTRGCRYTEIHPRHAIDAVFDGWEQLRPEPEDPAAVRDTLQRAHMAAAKVTLRPEGA
jgi:hypothetical protein